MIPARFKTSTTVAENPQRGKSREPFMNRTTGCASTMPWMRSATGAAPDSFGDSIRLSMAPERPRFYSLASAAQRSGV